MLYMLQLYKYIDTNSNMYIHFYVELNWMPKTMIECIDIWSEIK